MKFIDTEIADVKIIEPQVFEDSRGYFMESFKAKVFEENMGFVPNFIQDNESKSSLGVLRGLHYQLPPFAQSKLVKVSQGSVLDVAVDIRVGSPTFGKYVAVELSETNKKQLFIPRGFAHGFLVLSSSAIFNYKVDSYYAPDHDCGLAYNDPDIAIDWGFDLSKCELSHKDLKQKNLKEKLSDKSQLFDYQVNYYS